jgi:DNA-binding NarL/FixJ family response regulator
MNCPKNKNSILDIILRSILNNEEIASRAREISVAEMLEKVNSADVDETTKLIFFVLGISEILAKSSLLDLKSFFEKAFSAFTMDEGEGFLSRQRDMFVAKYKIKERDMQLITNICKGYSFKEFPDVMGISSSNANKKLRALIKRLEIEHREELAFTAGWFRLIPLDLPCLNIKR